MTPNRITLIITLVITTLLAFSATLLYFIIRINANSENNQDVNRQILDITKQHDALVDTNNNEIFDAIEILDNLKDCTTPGPDPIDAEGNTGHPCFDENIRRTTDTVLRVIDGVIFIRSCSEEGNLTDEALIICVKEKIDLMKSQKGAP